MVDNLENLNKLRLLIKEFLEKEENKDMFFFGLFVNISQKQEMGLCRTPGGDLDPEVIRQNFRDFVLRNFSEDHTPNAVITTSVIHGMIDALIKIGYAKRMEFSQNPFKNNPMAN